MAEMVEILYQTVPIQPKIEHSEPGRLRTACHRKVPRIVELMPAEPQQQARMALGTKQLKP